MTGNLHYNCSQYHFHFHQQTWVLNLRDISQNSPKAVNCSPSSWNCHGSFIIVYLWNASSVSADE